MSQFPRLNICYRNLEEMETDGITVMGAFTSGWFGIGIGYWTDGDQFIDMLQFGRGIVDDAHLYDGGNLIFRILTDAISVEGWLHKSASELWQGELEFP